ncbi:branched-chain amino acid ABC transporter permease [Desulfobotulus sp. H1]|uniref:Branched-chain amino acid ABC transporter permease n=1 Tax=Desulfobotulus pelophilus TaxID=2823377 RepID=A0ABT3NC00_9BACT|nr:branched-chain amino acid ABC transporter permease [Desulfobotulus pelophilus]MCW7754950.1 branched-chain amino acid ABC transporter permease [Desulfobotulus pelophilus]
MSGLDEVKKSLTAAVWFMFLTFPIMVVRVRPLDRTIEWRWDNMIYVGLSVFFGSFLWRKMLRRKEMGLRRQAMGEDSRRQNFLQKAAGNRRFLVPATMGILVITLLFPHLVNPYQISIMTLALIYVVLGLGLNIVVGQAGLLNLGYVAFFAVGAYSYALLNQHFGLGFWICLPIGASLAALFGILLALPVLRLRGDYLAIVTLGFGEITRIVLENWGAFSGGPIGIRNIPRPEFFGMTFSLSEAITFIYYIMIAAVIFTVFVINRLQNSRLGRAWVALREDEIACQAMGIDKARVKLSAFALGAMWAGMAGVIFAGYNTYINPKSFTFMESVIILSIVVLGGMGSILGVILGGLIMILLPEYLREVGHYRMLIFGAAMIVMMVFRPQGLIQGKRKAYQFQRDKKAA